LLAGIPAIAVALGLAVEVEAFDGKYDDNCVFRFVRAGII